jgi:hypothetical protein
MNGMLRYYISRAILSAALGALLAITGLQWWIALLAGIAAFAFFLYAPRSGRYAVNPELGVTALRRDERTQLINAKAAVNAFVITILAMGGIAIYFGAIVSAAVPVIAISLTMLIAILTYFVSDFWLRRSQ